LVAYLETLVAFTPYYRADDARMSGKMETFYQQALLRYKDYSYDEFHKYITKKMTAFYVRFGAPDAKDDPAYKSDNSGDVGEVVEVGSLPEGAIVSKRRYEMSGDEDEGGGGGGDACCCSCPSRRGRWRGYRRGGGGPCSPCGGSCRC
jgi:hypothetical protein